MACEKNIPVVEKITVFSKKDIKENPTFPYIREDAPQEIWNMVKDNVLLLCVGEDIIQYVNEYPYLRYETKTKEKEYPRNLNYNIKSITCSKVNMGKMISLASGKLTVGNIQRNNIVYYTDNCGINRMITDVFLSSFISEEKPNLVISPEGVLVFFTEEKIMATVDCLASYDFSEFGYFKDLNVEIIDDYCKLTLDSYTHGKTSFKLKFDIDLMSDCLFEVNLKDITKKDE